MSKDKINIGRETTLLLQKLGLDPGFVKEFTVTPTTVTATVFKRDESGSKYMVSAEDPYLPAQEGEDIAGFSQRVATEVLRYEVRT